MDKRSEILDKKRTTQLEQLLSIAANPPTFDGDLIDKSSARKLFEKGYIQKHDGFSCLTLKGLEVLVDLGYITP